MLGPSAPPPSGQLGPIAPTRFTRGPAQERELELMRSKSATATRVLVIACGCAAGLLAARDVYLALVPLAFILGWLNLVGL